MADQNNLRSFRAYDSQRQAAPAEDRYDGDAPDPLAELARLIGQSDPFADVERSLVRSERPRTTPVVPHPPETNWPPTEASSQPDPHPAQIYHATAPQAAPEPTFDPAEAFGHDAEQGNAAPSEAYPQDNAYAQEYAPYCDPNAFAEMEYQEELARRRRRTRMVAVLGIFALAGIGGASAYGYRTYVALAPSNSGPPVIMADTAPTKVIPVPKESDSSSTKLSYERIGQRGQPEKVVPREEKPIDVRAAAVTPPPEVAYPPAKVATIAPPPPTIPVAGHADPGTVLPVTAGSAIPAGRGSVLPSPKKVKTVAIRPDMSIMTQTAGTGIPPVGAPAAVAAAPKPPAPRAASMPVRAAAAQPVAAAPDASSAPATRGVAVPPPRRNAPLSLSPDAVAAPRAAEASRTVAAATPEPAAPPTSAAAAGGQYAVQIASQRSEAGAKASFRTLQARYANVLGGQPSFVKRADLGSRGVYYRTLVGPFATADEATRLCGALKAAGGSCLIHRN